MESVHIIPKDEFKQKMLEQLEHVTHVAVAIERADIYGVGDSFTYNAFSIVAAGITLESAAGVGEILSEALKPVAQDGFMTYCGDQEFIDAVTAKLEREKARLAEHHEQRNQRMMEAASVLNSAYSTPEQQVAAAMPIILEALAQHEQQKADTLDD